MYLYFEAQGVDESFQLVNQHGHSVNAIGPLSPVNIVIGPNNSRKSRFVRNVLKERRLRLTQKLLDDDFEAIIPIAEALVQQIPAQPVDIHFKYGNYTRTSHPPDSSIKGEVEAAEVYEAFGNRPPKIQFGKLYIQSFLDNLKAFAQTKSPDARTILGAEAQKIISVLKLMQAIKTHVPGRFIQLQYVHGNSPAQYSTIDYSGLLASLISFEQNQFTVVTPNFHYVPALRTIMKLFEKPDSPTPIDADTIEVTYRRNYDLALDGDIERIKFYTGLDLFDVVKSYRNNKRPIRQKFENFERHLGNTFFSTQSVDIVADNEQPILHFYSGRLHEDERELHNIGDGIQNIITIELPLYMSDNSDYIIIEEPENHLHPGLLNVFLNSLTKLVRDPKNKRIIFIVTHSNHIIEHIARNLDVCSLFKFTSAGQIRNVTTIERIDSDYLEVLGELGVGNMSVLLANCALWVEGPSDRNIISALLHAYWSSHKLSFIEGMDYAFFEYAGSNLSHYIFPNDTSSVNGIELRTIANKAFVLVDEDEAPEKKKRHLHMKTLNGPFFHYSTTGAVEIENLITWPILYKYLRTKKGAISGQVTPGSFTDSDFCGVRLGSWLKAQCSFKRAISDNGALSKEMKKELSDYVYNETLAGTLKWSDFEQNPNAKRLTLEFDNFIRRFRLA